MILTRLLLRPVEKTKVTGFVNCLDWRFVSIVSGVLFLFLLLVASCSSEELYLDRTPARTVNLGALQSVKTEGNDVEFESSSGIRLRISAIAKNVFRVRYTRLASFPQKHSFAIDKAKLLETVPLKMTESTDPGGKKLTLLETEDMLLSVNHECLALAFQDKITGNAISADAYDAIPMSVNGGYHSISKDIHPEENEHFFGLGDKVGPLDRLNQSFTFWNKDPALFQESTDPLYKSIPFLLVMRNGDAHGIYVDCAGRTNFEFGKILPHVYTLGANDLELDYYLINGPDPKKVIQSFTELVGRMPLPPLFSLGYQQSRGSYIPDSAVREVANELRQRKIPADVIYLDGDYKQDARPFTVNKKLFPDFSGLIRELDSKGFKTVISLDPYIAKEDSDPNFLAGLKNDYFLKQRGKVYYGKVWPESCAWPDFMRKDVREWWGSLHSELMKDGVRGIWDDMNEPAVSNANGTLPVGLIHMVDGKQVPHGLIHNAFALENTHATYDGMLGLKPKLRPFILTRSGFAGSQRYAATWTGDNTSTWNHMRISVPQLLNLGLSGLSFAGSDIGGFNGFSGGPSPELLTRWMQLGAFNPLFRNHSDGITRKREPWVDGPAHEAIRKKFIETRYRLLPYIYTCLEETSRNGIPLMRPLFLEFPKEKNLLTNSEEYFWGPSILVAPKLWDIAGPYPVTLPPGEWFDYWSGKKLDAGTSINVNPSVSEMPVFVRSGSIIPHQPVVQNSAEKPNGPLELHVYQGKDASCSGELYLDDGESFEYKKGEFLRLKFTSKRANSNSLEINLAEAEGKFKPWFDKYQIVVSGISEEPKSLTVDGNIAIGWLRQGEDLILPAMPWSDFAHRIQLSW